MANDKFSLEMKGNKVIVRTLVDVEEPHELTPFLEAYGNVVRNYNKKPKLKVLLDIRSLTLTVFKPKFPVLKRLTDFFLEMKDFSIANVAGVGILISNDYLANAIKKALQVYPSEVPTVTSSNIEYCKQFLKAL